VEETRDAAFIVCDPEVDAVTFEQEHAQIWSDERSRYAGCPREGQPLQFGRDFSRELSGHILAGVIGDVSKALFDIGTGVVADL
jgi:hypothetical protein